MFAARRLEERQTQVPQDRIEHPLHHQESRFSQLHRYIHDSNARYDHEHSLTSTAIREGYEAAMVTFINFNVISDQALSYALREATEVNVDYLSSFVDSIGRLVHHYVTRHFFGRHAIE